MAVVGEEVIQKDIQKKQLSNIYLLFGNDIYLKQYYSNKISSLACDGDPFFNLQKFESNCDLQDVYDAIKQYPMMAESKYVELYDYDFIKCDKDSLDKLCKIISEVEDGCVFLLRFDSVVFDIKKDSKAKKLISLVEKCNGKVVSLEHRSIAKLSKMLVTGASNRGCTISDSDAKYLIEISGDDICLLKNELDKLCAYVKEGTIDKNIIDTVCTKTVDASLYDFASFIISGNLTAALKLLDNLFFMRIEPMTILYSVSSVYTDLYRVFEGQKSSVSTDSISTDFDYGSRKFVLTKTANKLKSFSLQKLNRSLDIILKTDKMLKSSGIDERQILEKMTVDLSVALRGD